MGFTVIRGLLATSLMLAAGGLAAVPPSGEFVVKQAEGAPTVSLGGTVIPYKEVTLTAQLPGRVKYLSGIEGDAFKKDDLLVALDDRELLANRQALLAQMGSADAQLRNAGMQYNREIYAPRSRTPPGGMAIPNLFDQMFTRPAESFMGTSICSKKVSRPKASAVRASKRRMRKAASVSSFPLRLSIQSSSVKATSSSAGVSA